MEQPVPDLSCGTSQSPAILRDSHDASALRATLLGIEMTARLARRESVDDTMRAWLADIEGLCLEASYHLSQVIGFAVGGGPAATSRVDLHRLVTALVARHEELARRLDVAFDLHLDPNTPAAFVDEMTLAEVLASLVVWALHRASGGIVRLRCRKGPRRGWLSLRLAATTTHPSSEPEAASLDVSRYRDVIAGLGGSLRGVAFEPHQAALSIALPQVDGS